MQPEPSPTEAARWIPRAVSGWHYLLPPLAGRRVLCLCADHRLEVDLSVLCAELTLLHDPLLRGPGEADEGRISRASRNGIRQLRIGDDLAAHHRRFDGLILHDLQGDVIHGGNLSRVLHVLRSLADVLRPDAFVYFGIRNAWALPCRRTASGHWPISVRQLLNAMREQGWGPPRRSPYLVSDGWLNEVVCPPGYRASKNSERRAERAKEAVYGRLGARVFAPAYGLCFAGPAPATTLELLAEAIGRAPFWRGPKVPALKRCLVFPGAKAIATFGADHDDRHDVVAVLTSDGLSIERRQAEARVLTRLAELPPELAGLVPTALDRLDIGNTRCFLMTRLPGVTVDVESEALAEVSNRALEFVARMHCATLRQFTVDEARYRELFGEIFAAAVARNPWLEADLHEWEESMRSNLIGSTIPSVWMHGDFKVENIMYDRRTRGVSGVIDWELARLPGLPLLDPLYLLIYNRTIRGAELIDAMRSVLIPSRRNEAEQASLRRYVDAIGLADSLESTLCAMCLVHAIGCRVHIRDAPSDRQRISRFVHELAANLPH